jgi:hypothetical protein
VPLPDSFEARDFGSANQRKGENARTEGARRESRDARRHGSKTLKASFENVSYESEAKARSG